MGNELVTGGVFFISPVAVFFKGGEGMPKVLIADRVCCVQYRQASRTGATAPVLVAKK
jgi:hypothetical protein